MTTIINGVDYAWTHPGGAALKAADMHFACRYLSPDIKKNISRTEADDLAYHGLWSVVVWESTASRAGAGRAAGIADAQTALIQARTAGLPEGRPIYFAVDFDANPAAVAPYFQGVASVLTPARTGVYGGYRVVKALMDGGVAKWGWQTVAWSGGLWDARTHIRQDGHTVTINGVSCDKDFAYAADYGQWMPGKTPNTTTENPNMAVSAADAAEIAQAVLNATVTSSFRKDAKGNPVKIPVSSYLDHMDGHYDAVIKAIAALAGKNVDTAVVVKAVQTAIAASVIKVHVDVTEPVVPGGAA